MERIPLERVRRDRAAGTARPCVATALLDEAARGGGTLGARKEQEIASALGILYAAGTDTTTSVLTTSVLMMVLHPAVLRKAQDEIDRVTRGTRLPELSDRPALPYLEAVIKEVYRWLAPAPLGVPHQLTEDDEDAGFRLQRGTVIITNIWAMLHDEARYPRPEIFDPERFLTTGPAPGADPRKVVFGFGRRICPGRFLADSVVFLALAGLLAAFDIRPTSAPDGAEMALPAPDLVSGIVLHPRPFACDVSPRSREKADLVLSEAGGRER